MLLGASRPLDLLGVQRDDIPGRRVRELRVVLLAQGVLRLPALREPDDMRWSAGPGSVRGRGGTGRGSCEGEGGDVAAAVCHVHGRGGD